MKKIKILLIIALLFSFGITGVNAEGNTLSPESSGNKYDRLIDSDREMQSNQIINDKLNKLGNDSNFIKANTTGEAGVYYTILKIAQSLKNIFLVLATIYFLITVLKLLFAEGSSDEQWEKFKKGIRWISAGIIVMQLAYSYVKIIYNKQIGVAIVGSEGLTGLIVEPLLKLLETAAAFFFIMIMVFAFYKMVTASGEDEKAKEGKKSFIYAIIGFLIIKLSYYFVSATYSKTLCNIDEVRCTNPKELSDGAQIIFTIINWLNGFVGIAVVLMIIYTGAQIIFSGGEDEKIKKAKKSIIYIIVGILILIMNYFILTFFLTPELTK